MRPRPSYLAFAALAALAITTGGCRSAAASTAAPQCHADADCALSWRAPGRCCESLCVPRALVRAQVEAEGTRCEGSTAACFDPGCPSWRQTPVASCVAGACVPRFATMF